MMNKILARQKSNKEGIIFNQGFNVSLWILLKVYVTGLSVAILNTRISVSPLATPHSS